MTAWGALILAKWEAEFEVRRLAFRAIFLGEISSVSKDYSTWGDNTFSSNDTFNARTTRPLINVGFLIVGSWTSRTSTFGLLAYFWPLIFVCFDPTALLPLPMPINRHL